MAPPAPRGVKALAALVLFAGGTACAQDARTVVALDAAERDHVLAEMRGFLALIEKATAEAAARLPPARPEHPPADRRADRRCRQA